MLRTVSLVVLLLGGRVLADPVSLPPELQITLFDDYKCLPAPPMVQTDGGWFETDARKQRTDCALTGAQVELNDWRPKKQAATPEPPFQWQSSHTAITVTGFVVTLLTAYIQNRSARKLPILP